MSVADGRHDPCADQTEGPVCVVGAGYVGLVTAACLAESGATVRVVEIDAGRRASLQSARAPFHEPGLDVLLADVVASGRLSVTGDVRKAMQGANLAIVAVGTPPLPDGNADLSQVFSALDGLADATSASTTVVIKSTVPPGTAMALARHCARQAPHLRIVSCPEFLREGNALDDFRHPARIVVGGDDPAACARVASLFAHLPGERILTDPTSAEMIKYGANSFLALKISFINEIAHLCEKTGADVDSVARGIGTDPRIGTAFLRPGLGFGGSCFPKDVRALEETASYHGLSFWLLKAAIEVNTQQRRRFVDKVLAALGGRVAGRRIAVLGLAFKPGTDDMRQAASIEVIRHLQDLGAHVVATDPAAIGKASAALPGVDMVGDPYACVARAEAVVLVTEWPELVGLDWARVATLVRRKVVVDGRNALDGQLLADLGFTYHGVGRTPRRTLTGVAAQRRPAGGKRATAMRGGRRVSASTPA